MRKPEINIAYDKTSGVVTGEAVGYKLTPQDLVEFCGYTMTQVDIVPDSIVAKAWPTSMKLKTRDEDGKVTHEEPAQTWNHYLQLKFNVRHEDIVTTEVREQMLAEIRAEKAGAHDPKPPRKRRPKAGVVVELDLFDPHFQMLAWGPETGSNHDLDIIFERYREAAMYLADRARRDSVSRWLLVVGQDLFHTDTTIQGKGGQTARGTPQDVDTRLAKSAHAVRRLLTAVVCDLLETAPVDVVVVPGNHDTERSWWMGEILDARFEGNPNVHVDNRPMMRKYYRIGNSLIGFSHGHNLKAKDLRDYMSQEARQDWSDTVFREWHLGHFHHEHTLDERGVVARYFPSLAGTDAWHFENGFVSQQKGARAIVWSHDNGPMDVLHYNVPVTAKELAYTAPMLRGDR